MNKKQLSEFTAEQAGLTKAKAEAAVDAVFTAIADALSKGDDATFIGFGSFTVAERSARKGRNPQNGQEIDIPASKTVRFKVGKDLKEKLR